MQILRRIILLALFVSALALGAMAQNVNVTATGGTTNATYPTLTAAFNAVNGGTHTGAITVDITANTTEPGAAVLNSSGAGTASYTSVVIRPTADGVTISGATVAGRGLIELNGADNVTIDGDNPNTAGTNRNLTITNTAANTVTYTSVIRIALATTIVTSADNDIFRNLILNGSATGRNISTATSTAGTENLSYGILATGGASTTSATTAPTAISSATTLIAAGATANNLTIDNNAITTAARAVAVQGSATTVFPGLAITGNTIGNATAGAADGVYSFGITAQGSTNGVIARNTVYVESFVGTSIRGIDIGSISATGTGFTIERNTVNRVQASSTTGFGAYCYNIAAGNNQIVRDNFASGAINVANGNFSTTFGAFGIRVASGTGHQIYHNSVNLYGTQTGTGQGFSAGLVVVSSASTGMDIRNNIFADTQAGGSATSVFVSIYLLSGLTSAFNLTLNNNDYFQGTDPTKNGIAQVGTTTVSLYQAANFNPNDTASATNLRTYTSTLSAAGTNDNASKVVDPQFASASDLHINAASPLVDMGATISAGLDIDGQIRVDTPDIGADETDGVTPPANDIAATAITVPANGAVFAFGAAPAPKATFTNVGTATQTNVMVQFTITGPGGYTYIDMQVIGSINPNQTVTLTFAAAPAFTTAGTYTTTATVLTADGNAANNTVSGTFSVIAPFTGAVSVGTGQTYTSLTNAGGIFAALNAAGATSNVIINITSDLTGETGAVALNELAGGYTVTIKPTGAARTITGSSATGLLNFNGTDFVTIDGSLAGGTDRSLTVTNTGAGGGISFTSGTNGAQNNTVKNVNVFGGSPTATVIGIAFGGNTFGSAGTDNDNNHVENCDLRSSIYGIYSVGASAANENVGTIITRNVMTATGTARIGRIGIFVGFEDGVQITQNNINGIVSAETADAIGIGVGAQGISTTAAAPIDVTNALITRNNIGLVQQTNTYSAAGIVLASGTTGTNTIRNNFVSGVIGNSNSGDFVVGIYVLPIAGATQNVYFNSVSMTGARGATASQYGSFALALAGTDQAVDVRDNILYNTQTQTGTGTTGRSYAYGINSATFANLTSNYNDLYVSGAQGTTGITGGLLNTTGTDRTSLADFQTATGKDTNSLSVDPLFTSTTDLHLLTGSPVINAGITIAGVTADIDGQTRDATPDIGADEFGSPQPGVLALSSATYSVNEPAGTVTVTVNRTGGTDNAVAVNYTLTNGTATGGATCAAGVDYVNAGGTVNFTAGQASQTFTVQICDDAVFEGNETFNVNLTTTTGGATVGAQATAVVTIVDDEIAQPGTLAFSSPTYTISESGATATITVNRTGGSDGSVTVDYATVNGGTATGGAGCGGAVDYINTAGTLTFGNGVTTQTFTIPICNDTLDEANETVNLQLSNATGGAIIGAQNTAVLTITDDDPTPSLSISDVSQAEGNSGTTAFTFTVTLSAASGQTVTVNYATADGTATAPGDYAAIANTVLTFAPGETTKQITVNVVGDTLNETDETFFVNLSGATNATIGDNQGLGTIQNDDAAPSLSINDVSQAEGNSGTTAFSFTVTLSAASGQTVTVNYATANGTATAPSDYTAVPSTALTFAPGETTKTITVLVNGDTAFEPDETFFVNLSGAANATLADAQGQGTIVNDDANPAALTISDARVTEGNSGMTTATFTVTLTGFPAPLTEGGNPNVVTVNYATADGTATAGADYVSTSGTLTFNQGETTKTISVSVIGDTLKEANETFFVNLINAQNANITDAQGVGIIVDDDRAYVSDFDRDRKTDLTVFRPSAGYWYTLQSSNDIPSYRAFGADGDIPTPGDYDADGVTDLAVFRPSNGTWYIQQSSTLALVSRQFGQAGDLPVQGDYDGDAKTDLAVFRNGIFYVFQSTTNSSLATPFGTATDVPVQGDYDGDARTDYAVYRGGTWYVLRSRDNSVFGITYGAATDTPVVGDFDGDGKADFTVYRGGTWYIFQTLTGTSRAVVFGAATDIPVPGDYDGDGTTDVAVFRPSNGTWYALRSADDSFYARPWGQNGDIPIPAAYQAPMGTTPPRPAAEKTEEESKDFASTSSSDKN